MAPDDSDPPVTAPLDAATMRELAKWFELPSYDEAEPSPAEPAVDPEVAALLERRAQATAAVDPALVAAIAARTHRDPSELLHFDPTVELRVDPELALFDHGAVDRGFALAEPREVEIPDALRDDLKDCTPQALLRDLHRAELSFDKQFELVEYAPRVDGPGEVATAMATSWRLRAFEARPLDEIEASIREARQVRQQPWPRLFAQQPLIHRRIVE